MFALLENPDARDRVSRLTEGMNPVRPLGFYGVEVISW